MAASSDGRLCHDNVTLTFDLLTPKPNQVIFVPRCTDDNSLAKIHQQNTSTDTGDIMETQSRMHGRALTEEWTKAYTKHIASGAYILL